MYVVLAQALKETPTTKKSGIHSHSRLYFLLIQLADPVFTDNKIKMETLLVANYR